MLNARSPIIILSIFPSLVIMILMLIACGVVTRWTGFYRDLVTASQRGRYVALDGLRGYLASSVFFCHTVSYYFHFRDGGGWQWPASKFYTFAGQVPVILFFMITGFLFWGKMLAGKVQWRKHYQNRFWRIMPLYLFLAIMVLAVVAAETHFRPQVPFPTLVKGVLCLLVPGRGWPTVNGLHAGTMMAMAWTLRYEIAFYIALPALAVFASDRGFLLFCLICAVAYGLSLLNKTWAQATGPQYWIVFLFGMAVAQILPMLPALGTWGRHGLSVLAIGCFGLVGLFPADAYQLSVCAILGIAFLCFAWGADVFGLLTMRAARALGTISYSVYLLHLIVLHVVLWSIQRYRPVSEISAEWYWVLTGGTGVLLTLIALTTYRYIEHPFLHGFSKARVFEPTPKMDLTGACQSLEKTPLLQPARV